MGNWMSRILIMLIVLGMLIPNIALANEGTKLSDMKGHWAEENTTYLVNRGAISGYPDGTFKPDKTITCAEFLKIALKGTKVGAPVSNGSDWALGVFKDAIGMGILKDGEIPKDVWDKPITRYQMTMIMIRITEKILNEKPVEVTGIENIMADYQKVSNQTQYKYYVEQAYMKGLITGIDSKGTFGGDDTGTRAEATMMIMRILEVSKRRPVKVD